jgi:hypothetical protein
MRLPDEFYHRLWDYLRKGELRTMVRCIVNQDEECNLKCPLCLVREREGDEFSLLCKKFDPPQIMGNYSLTQLVWWLKRERGGRA